MRLRLLSWGLGTLCVGWALAQPTAAHAQVRRQQADQVPPALRLAVRKQPNLRFSGTRMVEQFIGAERQRHTEYVLRDGSRTRTWFPNGSPYAGQVIVENLRQRQHYFPGRNEIRVGPAKREEAFGRLLKMVASGEIKFGTESGGNIAGRSSTLVSIKERSNVVQKLWIDVETGLILRRDLFDLVGARVGSYEFTEVDFKPSLQASDFELERKGARIVTPRDEAKALAKRIGITAYTLPETEEFGLDSARVLRGAQLPVLHQAFSRNLSYVSLFQAKGRVELPMTKRVAKEGVEVHTWVAGGNTFALVGNLTSTELKRLARLLTTL